METFQTFLKLKLFDVFYGSDDIFDHKYCTEPDNLFNIKEIV